MVARPDNARSTMTGWWLDDIPGQFAFPFKWSLTRGVLPHTAAIFATDDRFEGLENPVTLSIVAPNAAGDDVEQLDIANLYLLERRRGSKGIFQYLLADVRWFLGFGSIDASYNILGNLEADPPYRPESLTSGEGSSRWTVAGAAADALQKLVDSISEDQGRAIAPPPAVAIRTGAPELVEDLLPDNLGNSRGGGFVGAKLRQFLPTILADAGDLTVHPDGRLAIVGRNEPLWTPDVGHMLLDGATEDGTVEPKSVQWQWPGKLRCKFEKRYGNVLEKVTADDTSRTQAADPFTMSMENVLPEPSNTPDATGAAKWLTDVEFYANEIVNQFGINNGWVLERITHPQPIPRLNLTTETELQAEHVEDLLWAFWRRGWRVIDNSVRRNFADIELGRLRADGTTQSSVVRMDYSILKRWVDDVAHPLSRNKESIARSSGQLDRYRSPFDAQWVNREDLVFYLNEQPQPIEVRSVWPALFDDDHHTRLVAPEKRFTDDNAVLPAVDLGRFRGEWELYVPWHGLYVGTDEPRTYDLEIDLFEGAPNKVVEILADGITANFRKDHPEDLEFELLNIGELQDRAEFLASQIKKTYEQNRAGLLTFNGVDVLTRGGAEVIGDVRRIDIEIGEGEREFAVQTVVDIRPEFRPPLLSPQAPAEPRKIL